MSSTEPPQIPFPSSAAFRAWLAEHHSDMPGGIWLVLARKNSGIESVNYQEALREALCYGWIDGQARSLDDQRWLQRFTPRRPRSRWSQRNCGIAEELIAQGQMQPAGLREIEAARADGRWEGAYASPAKITVPDDFQAALQDNPKAAEFFATLKGSNRYAILYRIQDCKRAETRARRIEKFVGMLERGETLY